MIQKFILLTFLMLLMLPIAFIGGCADDIILEEPPSLVGSYAGMYSITLLSSQTVIEEAILWRFDEKFFFMNLDPDNFVSKCFCALSGQYSLEEGVRLVITSSQPDDAIGSCTSCNQNENPAGLFVLDKSTSATKMTRQSGDTLMIITLNPITP